MRIVIALGGNALLKRGEPMTPQAQRSNIRSAARAIAALADDHELIITHGNGPQVGLMALQAAAYSPDVNWPLDILGAESVGMIGYLVEQELSNALPAGTKLATLLTQIEIAPDDPAFSKPEKPIGPIYTEAVAKSLQSKEGWAIVEETKDKWRRVVASPIPQSIPQIDAIKILVEAGVVVTCAGGGGIPVIREHDGTLLGVEAVIDKDRAACLLAHELDADAFLMLTDVDAVYLDWGKPEQKALRLVGPGDLNAKDFPAGSMAPKIEAATDFASKRGKISGIGRLEDVKAILAGKAGTLFKRYL